MDTVTAPATEHYASSREGLEDHLNMVRREGASLREQIEAPIKTRHFLKEVVENYFGERDIPLVDRFWTKLSATTSEEPILKESEEHNANLMEWLRWITQGEQAGLINLIRLLSEEFGKAFILAKPA